MEDIRQLETETFVWVKDHIEPLKIRGEICSTLTNTRDGEGYWVTNPLCLKFFCTLPQIIQIGYHRVK